MKEVFNLFYSCFLIVLLLTECGAKKRNQEIRHPNNSYNANISERYVKLCYGIKVPIDTSNFYEHLITLINSSDNDGFIRLVKSKLNRLDTVRWHSGFYGLIIPDSNIVSYKPTIYRYQPEDYLSYRFNELEADLANDELVWILRNGVDNNSYTPLFELQHAEATMLIFAPERLPDSVVAIQAIEEIQKLYMKYPESRRLKFLLGKAYLKSNDVNSALPLFDYLIDEDYYSRSSLTQVIDFFSNRYDSIRVQKYLQIFRTKFPDASIPASALFTVAKDSVKYFSTQCVQLGNQRDSILASIYFANYAFQRKDFQLVDSILAYYTRFHIFDFANDILRQQEEDFYAELIRRRTHQIR